MFEMSITIKFNASSLYELLKITLHMVGIRWYLKKTDKS